VGREERRGAMRGEWGGGGKEEVFGSWQNRGRGGEVGRPRGGQVGGDVRGKSQWVRQLPHRWKTENGDSQKTGGGRGKERERRTWGGRGDDEGVTLMNENLQ